MRKNKKLWNMLIKFVTLSALILTTSCLHLQKSSPVKTSPAHKGNGKKRLQKNGKEDLT